MVVVSGSVVLSSSAPRGPRFGRWLESSAFRCVGLALSGVLVTSTLQVTAADPAAAAPEGDGPNPTDAGAAESGVRPDSVSAMVSAQTTGERVEDLSQRTPEMSVFANPDGSWTSEESTEPFRVQDEESGEWVDIDPTLVERDGAWVPRAAAAEVSFSAGGDRGFVELVENGTTVTWRAPEALPVPVVEGDTITYPDAWPGGGDLVATAHGTGFTHYVVLHEPPAELNAASEAGVDNESQSTPPAESSQEPSTESSPESGQSAEPLVVSLPVVVSGGGEVSVNDNGGVVITDGDGERLLTAPAPLMWDSSDQAQGQGSGEVGDETDPAVRPVEASVATTRRGRAAVELEVDAEFLSDSETVYPVVIDPSWTNYSNGDTWVQNRDYTSSQGSSPELRVGTYDGGTTRARSFLRFNNAPVHGKQILSATLVMRNFYSGSCTSGRIWVRRITGGEVDWPSLTWANQPGSNTTHQASYDPAHGYTSACGVANATWNLTDLASAWASGSLNNFGLKMMADNESSNFTWRKYRSVNYAAHPNLRPKMVINYNSYPATAGKPTLTPGTTGYATSLTPTVKATVSDPDGGRVRARFEILQGSTVKWSGTSAYVSSGGTASMNVPAGKLDNGGSYVLRAKGDDGSLVSKSWSASAPFVADISPPEVTGLSCTNGLQTGSWYETRPAASTVCTVSATKATQVEWSLNGLNRGWVTATAGSGISASATLPSIAVPTEGYTKISVRVKSASNLYSPTRDYGFGTGPAGLTEPLTDDRSSTTFPVSASAQAGASSAKVQWRLAPTNAGDESTGWTDAQYVAVAASGSTWSGSVSFVEGMSTTPRLLWDARAESAITSGALVQVRVAFSYPGDTVKHSPFRQVHVVPSAFGGSFPTAEVGPGTVALSTGEVSLSSTDVEVPGYAEPLSLGRSYLSMSGETSAPAGVFGPGWEADLAGPEWGAGAFTIIDRTDEDGTIQLSDNAGETYVYQHTSGTRGAQRAGTYVGVGETALLENTLTLAKGETPKNDGRDRLTLEEADGTKTVFVRVPASEPIMWVTEKVIGAENTATTRFEHNPDGTVAAIHAPAPAGVNCDKGPTEKGCRSLLIDYTGGGATKRLSRVQLITWDPEADAMATVDLARYNYDSQHRLVAAWDPRLEEDDPDGAGALKTTYGYDTLAGKTLLTSITQPGLEPWNLVYDSSGRLARVTRTHDSAVPHASDPATWTVAYDVPVSGPGLPDLRGTATSAWAQPEDGAPTHAAAVFGPDHVPGGALNAPAPADASWEWAALSYFNDAGRITNTARFGAGAWQIDSQRYDAHGNVIWLLGAEGRARALAAAADSDSDGVGDADAASAAEAHASLTVFNADGTRVEETYGPVHDVVLKNGQSLTGRRWSETVYDDEAPKALMPGRPTEVPEGGFGLPIEQRTGFTTRSGTGDGGTDHDSEVIRYVYEPLVAGDGDGWDLRTPTRTMVEDDTIQGGFATTITRFDAEAKPIETRTPAAVAAESTTDARVRQTLYYTPGAGSAAAECRDKPEWAGEVCLTRPAGAPSAGQPAPTEHVVAYSRLLTPILVHETSGSTTRTSTTEVDKAERPTSTVLSLGGDITTTTFAYDSDTGLPSQITGRGKTQTAHYDSWGRVRTQADGTGNTATTAYDNAGRVASVDDGKGVYTYSYNADDAYGRAERRGLVTSVDLGYASGSSDVIRGAYDAAGALTMQVFPGGTTVTSATDAAGNHTQLNYTNGGADAASLVGYSQSFDHLGRVREASGPARSVVYDYDKRSRLTRVRESVLLGVDIEDDTAGTDGEQGNCTTRRYAFTADSNRASLTTYGPAADGTCQQTVGATTASYGYDTGDRIVGDGYTYDAHGRTLTVPKAHTDQAGNAVSGPESDLAISYFANDMVATLQQTVPGPGGAGEMIKRQEFTLDATARISQIARVTDNHKLQEDTHHYINANDAPAWTQSRTRPNIATAWTESWSRYITDLGGGLAITQLSSGERTLDLSDPHGDLVASINLTNSEFTRYSDYTEYGTPIDASNATPGRYGWIGTHQRENQGILGGLSTMGARLYNPATGRFLSIDPVYGGNDNPYIYPANPVGMADLSGEVAGILYMKTMKWYGSVFNFFSAKKRFYNRKGYKYIFYMTYSARNTLASGKYPAIVHLLTGVGGFAAAKHPVLAGVGLLLTGAYIHISGVARDAKRRRRSMRITVYQAFSGFVWIRAWVN